MAIKGLAGNEMAQPRVFAHDAVAISGSNTQIAGTESRGCCLYVGTGGSIVVRMEGSSSDVTFTARAKRHIYACISYTLHKWRKWYFSFILR